MARLLWDQTGEKFYETGVNQGVLYVYDSAAADPTKAYGPGVAWNGLSSVSETPSGAEANKIYADNINYLNLYSAEEFGATIEAYTYPDAFKACDGTAEIVNGAFIGQQTRKTFGFCFKTIIGNDVDGDAKGYKLHLIYGCKASPSEAQYQTVNDSPEAIAFSWEITTTPIAIGKINNVPYNPASRIVIDSTKFTTEAQKAALAALEDKLFGTDTSGQTAGTDAYLPLPAEVVQTLTVANG